MTLIGTNRFGVGRIERTVAVHPEHEAAVRSFNDFAVRNAKRFLILVAILTLAVAPLSVILISVDPRWGLFGSAASVAAIGVLVLRYPFATPETVRWLGIRTSIRIARYSGVVLLLMAVGLLVMTRWV